MSLVDACALDELGETPLAVTVGDVDLALVRSGEEVFAIFDECSHAKIKLSEGDVEDSTLECWRHGARFDLRTGEPLDLPATEPVPVYPTTIEDGRVLVDLDNPIKTTQTLEN
ncbi:3-phenylpropionate/trans-cinnamate dioxygenase ferredoxin subunit [Luteococcus japonicus]|uniref:Ferredoxin, 2Fe-2S n=2 Tax=Luteococcus japonicus TaxID=33984 RepID=A0A1R4KL89_9ACTN|nr:MULTISPECIES: non-heme iron oxygenase ferredoxin subunit [Luteococcus]MDN5563858.1 non-heme iron oxygenase ferredoxin subunit [Luteococcus sp.]ROR55660.1 3-phenylpropionate/trans-cinnamate dioxygenase ferredoxin subunit [Luteococcus japonicus]SJN45110.1 Ferredoxin, 2Fe-2S [Luteococcus japonicus LSP_Lj1]